MGAAGSPCHLDMHTNIRIGLKHQVKQSNLQTFYSLDKNSEVVTVVCMQNELHYVTNNHFYKSSISLSENTHYGQQWLKIFRVVISYIIIFFFLFTLFFILKSITLSACSQVHTHRGHQYYYTIHHHY